ncbi:hypothetical protein FSEG_02151 [Fusobacterium necrophorum D12]|nr:hypothetical protein FSEG_02151 [Fusobacterium necrophorum D12]
MKNKRKLLLEFFLFTFGIPIVAIIFYKIFPNLFLPFLGIKGYTIAGFFVFFIA